jgi:hypothetical protein
MLSSLKKFCGIIVAFVATTSAFAGDPNPVRTMNVNLTSSGETGHAEIWAADGTHFSDLELVADAATKFGMTMISLYVLPSGRGPVATAASADQHVGIKIFSDHVELFVSSDVPYEFTKTLSMNLRQLPNVSEVRLRSTESRDNATEADTGDDPFSKSATNSDAQPVKRKQSTDPFGNDGL